MKSEFFLIAVGVVACIGGWLCCGILFAVGAGLI